ncbi:MAG: transporter substrate-binding domain-containing protein [Burkholderiaceae bacterium]|nr:transporter substrate-binding domain-containing protein [Burkholderiaceae bacterium]
MRLNLSLWLVLLGTLALHPAHAAPQATCTRPLTVAYFDIGALYNGATGKGIDRDLVEEIGRRIGCKVSARFLSRTLVLHLMETGHLDISASAIPTPERAKFAEFVPYFWTRNELITLANPPLPDTPDGFLSAPDLRLGVVRRYLHGAGWDEWIEALRAQGRVVEASDTHELVQLLYAGRISAFPAIPYVSMTFLDISGRRTPIKRARWFADQPGTEGTLLLSRTTLDQPTRDAIAQAVREMREDGTLATIFARYVPDKKDVAAMLGGGK